MKTNPNLAAIVAAMYRLYPEMMDGGRSPKACAIRHAAARVAREMTLASWTEIAAEFGMKSHTSLMTATFRKRDDANVIAIAAKIREHLETT